MGGGMVVSADRIRCRRHTRGEHDEHEYGHNNRGNDPLRDGQHASVCSVENLSDPFLKDWLKSTAAVIFVERPDGQRANPVVIGVFSGRWRNLPMTLVTIEKRSVYDGETAPADRATGRMCGKCFPSKMRIGKSPRNPFKKLRSGNAWPF